MPDHAGQHKFKFRLSFYAKKNQICIWLRITCGNGSNYIFKNFTFHLICTAHTVRSESHMSNNNKKKSDLCHFVLAVWTQPEIFLLAYKIAASVGRETQCNLVGVQNGFWLQACGRRADPLIQHREDAVHPHCSSGPVQSNESLTVWTSEPSLSALLPSHNMKYDLHKGFKMRSRSPKGPVSHSRILPTGRGVLNTRLSFCLLQLREDWLL